MTIESGLGELAAALKDLASAIRESAGAPGKAPATPAKGKDKKETPSGPQKEPPALTPAAPAAGASTATAGGVPDTNASSSSTSAADKPLNFDTDIGPRFLALIEKRGREAGAKIVAMFDPSKTRLSEAVKPEQYPELLTTIEAALAEE